MHQRKRNTSSQSTSSSLVQSANVFLLKKRTEGSTLGVSADFSQYTKCMDDGESSDKPTFPSIPVFNKDRRFYTPCFILSEDIAKFDENQELCLNNHIRKVRELQQEKLQMYLPKPSKVNSYCQICRDSFDEYLTHINKPSHLMKMKASSFYNDVLDLCSKINPHSRPYRLKKIKKERKKKSTGLPELTKKKSTGKPMENLSTGLHSQQYSNPVN